MTFRDRGTDVASNIYNIMTVSLQNDAKNMYFLFKIKRITDVTPYDFIFKFINSEHPHPNPNPLFQNMKNVPCNN